MQEHLRELSRQIALGDMLGANIILGLIARDKPKFSHSIDLGRSDAAAIHARHAQRRSVKLDAAA